MRTGRKILLGVAMMLAVTGCAVLLALGPVVRARVAAQARTRGLDVHVGRVRAGLGRIRLLDVRVTAARVPAVEVHLAEVEVKLSITMGAQEVSAHGGAITISGSINEVESQVRGWAAQGGGGDGKRGGRVRPYSAEGLQLNWANAFAGAQEQRAWGLRYARLEDGTERVGAEVVQLSHRGLSLELSQPTIELSRRDGGRVIDQIAARSVMGRVDLDALLGSGGDSRATKPLAPEELGKRKPADRPPTPNGAAGTSHVSPGRRVSAELGRLTSAIQSLLPQDAGLELSSLSLQVKSQGQAVNVGPARLVVGRDAKRIKLELVPGSNLQETPLELHLDLPVGGGDAAIEVDGGPVTLLALGVAERSFGLLDVARTNVSLKGRVLLRAGGDTITFSGNSAIAHLNIENPRIASEPMRDINIGWRGRGEITGSLDSLRIDETELNIGKTRLQLAGNIHWSHGELTRGELRGGVPLASCQSMMSSAPRGLLPILEGMSLEGTFSLQTAASFDFSKKMPPQVTWNMANDCRITGIPPDLDPRRFSKPWTREVVGADSQPVTLETGPGTPPWVPLPAISRYMPIAILICEDAGFYRHRGFDQAAIASALRDNLQAGQFVRGASTVSMQLAKNLYLARDKTASRKLQEAVLTLLLEQVLSKDELMELYLNVIEFGPGVYGIGPAAAYYFNSTAAQLSLGQSLYLASILPNPSSHHFQPSGEVTDRWMSYLHKLMQIARKINRISDEELADGLAEVIAFRRPHEPTPTFEETVPPDTAVFGSSMPASAEPQDDGIDRDQVIEQE